MKKTIEYILKEWRIMVKAYNKFADESEAGSIMQFHWREKAKDLQNRINEIKEVV